MIYVLTFVVWFSAGYMATRYWELRRAARNSEK